jgi:hypothetical protein
MRLRQILTVGGWTLGAAVAWYYLAGRYGEPGGLVGDVTQTLAALAGIVRGHRLTHEPYDTDTGVVDAEPADLAAQAGLDLDTYALARMIASEEGTSSNIVKAAVAWATVNHAERAGKSISDLLLAANNPDHRGYFGTQKDIDDASPNQGKSDRYASTALDPYDADGQIAAQVMSGDLPDFTHGADQFDRPAGESNPDKVAANRIASGSVAVAVDGLDDAGIRFWRRA